MNGVPQAEGRRALVRLAVIIASYGLTNLTDTAVAAVHREAEIAQAWVVDNQGDYQPSGGEQVIRPGRNLGWLIGSNAGLGAAQARGGFDGYVLLNNDVELSTGFFAGLAAGASRAGADLAGPTYDGFWVHQHTPAPLQQPEQIWRAPFIDGTCMLITPRLLDGIGGLDPAFARHGWGGEIDYCLRARATGHRVAVTAAAYLTHLNEATALAVHGAGYRDKARQIMYQEMDARYGTGWDGRCGIGEASHNTVMATPARRWAETQWLRSTGRLRRATRSTVRRSARYVDLGVADG